jgi:hypothetical protein
MPSVTFDTADAQWNFAFTWEPGNRFTITPTGTEYYDSNSGAANQNAYWEGQYGPDGVLVAEEDRDPDDVLDFGENFHTNPLVYPATDLKPTAVVLKAVPYGSGTPVLNGHTDCVQPNLGATYYPGDFGNGGKQDVYVTVNTSNFTDNVGELSFDYEQTPGTVGGTWNGGTLGGRWDRPTRHNIKNGKFCEDTGLWASESIVTDSQGRQVIDWFADED